jgi:hypothetical protein
MVWGSNPSGGKIVCTRPERPWGQAHPASYTMDTRSFPGVKWLGRVVHHPPPSSAEVKERVELYFYSPSVPLLQVIGCTLRLNHGAEVFVLFYFVKYLVVLQLVKKLRASYGTWICHTVFGRACHQTLFWAKLIQPIPSHSFCLRSNSMLLFIPSWCSACGQFLFGFPSKKFLISWICDV